MRTLSYMMPELFKINVKPGYNWLVVKVASPAWVGNQRREWGAKLQVFVEEKRGLSNE